MPISKIKCSSKINRIERDDTLSSSQTPHDVEYTFFDIIN